MSYVNKVISEKSLACLPPSPFIVDHFEKTHNDTDGVMNLKEGAAADHLLYESRPMYETTSQEDTHVSDRRLVAQKQPYSQPSSPSSPYNNGLSEKSLASPPLLLPANDEGRHAANFTSETKLALYIPTQASAESGHSLSLPLQYIR